MSVLVASDDEEAARALCSALSRAGLIAAWAPSVAEAWRNVSQSPPMVLVADTELPEISDLIEEIREDNPWVRVYLMADPDGIVPRLTAPLVAKPFDAAQFADLLAREVELAELERGRRSLLAHVDELALLVQSSFEAIIGLSEEGLILSWNHGAETLYGYEAGEIIGRNIDVLEAGEAPLERLARGERQVTEVRRRTKAGHDVFVHLSLSPVPQTQYTALRFAEVSLDVTARRKLERELEHAERLATVGRMAASMAHEINNPLAVIRASTGYVAQIASQIGDVDLGEAAEDMEVAAERIGSFVQHLCGFARRERAHLELAPISKTVSLALRMVKPRAVERGVTLEVAEIPEVSLAHDPPRLAQAVVNVVANAIDAAALGGGTVKLSIQSAEDRVAIWVEDDGPGLPDEIRDRVFEPFTTTKPHGMGTGLGLAITAQIVRDHGGEVRLEPAARGTRALIELSAPVTGAKRVLVLNADPSMRRVLASALRASHFEVSTADNLAEAQSVLKAGAAHVLVAQAPIDTDDLEQLRAASPEMRVLLVSGDGNDVPSGVESLAGPLNHEHLTETVRRLSRD
ncbi:MAG: PAS domain S-box protein [Myxococcales bacterium]|nr:PAS domain S-box protein [Myxococcales bacterium]